MIANEDPAIEALRAAGQRVVVTPAGEKWRVCLVPPVEGLPAFSQFDDHHEALGAAAVMAHVTGWHLADLSGEFGADDLELAKQTAGAIARKSFGRGRVDRIWDLLAKLAR